MELFLEVTREWANTLLVWIGFGTVVGLAAKALMPGRDQGGALATLFMGIGGSVVGMGALAYFWEGHRATPLSLDGFVAAIAGAFLLLFFNRVLQGYFFREAGTGPATATTRAPRRPRAATVVVREE